MPRPSIAALLRAARVTRRRSARRPASRIESVERRIVLSSLSLTISPDTISEGDGAGASIGTVTRNSSAGDLTVQLASSDSSELIVPASVLIPAGSLSASFSIDAVDDSLLDGSQTVQVTATTAGTIAIDSTFGTNGFGSVPGQIARDAAVTDNGQIVVVFSAGADFGVSRLNADGSVDTSFGTNGLAVADVSGESDRPEAVAIQSDGKIVVAGIGYNGPYFDYVLARFNTDGTLDSTFGTGGTVLIDMGGGSYNEIWDLAIQDDGKILAGGNLANNGTNLAVTRYNTDGSIDTTFGSGGTAEVDTSRGSDRGHGIAIQADGRIVLSGGSFGGNSTSTVTLARFTPSGLRDATFGSNGVVQTNLPGSYEQGSEVAIQDDGRIVVVGRVSDEGVFPPEYNPVVLRYLSDGSLDPSFGTSGSGYTVASGFAGSYSHAGIEVLSDGRIVATSKSSSAPNLNVYSESGVLQQTINLTGANAVQVAVGSADKIFVVAGNSLSVTGVTKLTSSSSSASATVTVTDLETLDLAFSSVATEGDLLTATVTRSNSDTNDPVLVSLSYSDSGELTGPASLTIPAGAQSASFPLSAVQDFDLDGNVAASVSASAAGYEAATTSTTVIDSGQVQIDIVPNDEFNRVDSKSKEVAVAILSSASFDATDVDLSSLRLGETGTEASVRSHKKHGYRFEIQDLNGDGLLDLIVRFDATDLDRTVGTSTLLLTGTTNDGRAFHGSGDIEFFRGRGGGRKKK